MGRKRQLLINRTDTYRLLSSVQRSWDIVPVPRTTLVMPSQKHCRLKNGRGLPSGWISYTTNHFCRPRKINEETHVWDSRITRLFILLCLPCNTSISFSDVPEERLRLFQFLDNITFLFQQFSILLAPIGLVDLVEFLDSIAFSPQSAHAVLQVLSG